MGIFIHCQHVGVCTKQKSSLRPKITYSFLI